MFAAALFIIVNTWKQPQGPLKDEQIEKCGVCVHTLEY